MWGVPGSALIAETVLLLLWASAVGLIWRKTPRTDLALWAVAWACRACGSIYGAQYADQAGEGLALYVGLQAAAGMLLLAVMVRTELRVCREKLAAHVRDRIQW